MAGKQSKIATEASKKSANAGPAEFVISRTIDAPRELVYKAWTDPAMMAQWWGPRIMHTPVCQMDVRVGGAYRIVMRSPEGVDYPMSGKFVEVVAPERLVMTMDVSEHPGAWHDMIKPNRAKGENNPVGELLQTVMFEDACGKTKLTVCTRIATEAIRDAMVKMGMNEGWSESLERLGEVLAKKDGPLVVERVMDAPAADVWRAITDNDAIKQWYFQLPEFKAQVGFAFEFTAEDKGVKYVHHCVIKEVIALKKLAYSWRYEGYEGDSLVAFELFGEGAKTRVRVTHTGLETFPKLPGFVRTNFEMGWTAIVGTGLKDFVEKKFDRAMVITRVINAPRALVFKAWTDPKHIGQWWGPRGFTTTTHAMDFRAGGQWRFVMHGPDGTDYKNDIVYTEIVDGEKLAYDHGGDVPGEAPHFRSTITFEDVNGKTKVTMRALFPTVEAYEGAKKFGATEGGNQTLERLEEYLAKQ